MGLAMIYYLSREDYTQPIADLLEGLGRDGRFIRSDSYERLFYERRAPLGHYVFTDFDRLTSYELESACSFAAALQRQAPQARIYNHPTRVLERYPLLRKLADEGLNSFAVTRFDAGERPERYPVFIRLEDDCQGPDSPLIHDAEQFEQALASLAAQGKPAKRRIAVEFCAEQDGDGYYRKYGAFNLCGRIVPQHILRSTDWNVKRSHLTSDADFAAEELAFARDNPHQRELQRIFALARIDYGRIDYGVVKGAIQTYEINTNPTYPDFKHKSSDARQERRELVRRLVLEGLRALDVRELRGPRFAFALPEPVLEDPRLPRHGTLRAWLVGVRNRANRFRARRRRR
ncbi:MAG: hypothetical protein WEF50_16965 [Myxococcota bacterium]